ncbi:MAG: hypothetical protein QG650_377 [Patescibacteria group bacterium]|nr:hypothetical protein [Patescibacteria group bacterium]
MLKFVEFLQKRPKDATIRSVRAGYAVVLASLLAFAHADYVLPFASSLGEPNATYAEYALASLVLIPGLVAAFGFCVAKRKHVRMAQIAGSVFLFVLAGSISPVFPTAKSPSPTASTGSLSASELATAQTEDETPISVSGWLRLLAFLPLISGISGKMITAKCLKHGEVIKKIRV